MTVGNLRRRANGGRLRLHFSICTSLLMITGAFNAIATYGQAEIGAPTVGTNTNDWIIERSDEIFRESDDGDITLSSNLFVKGILHLSNIELVFDCTSDGQFRLCVDQGGSLFIDNCTIGTTSENSRFKFMIYGHMYILNTIVSGTWADVDERIGGIQVFSDNVFIEKCTFTDMAVAIYVYHSAPSISGNTITNCDYGIIIDSDSVLSPTDFELDSDTMAFSDNNPVNGETIEISVDVTNNGGTPALATVRFYDGNPIYNGVRIDTEQTAFLISGQTKTFQVSWHAISGDHDIYVIVNEDRTIKETSYDDNIGIKSITPSFQLTVRKAGPGSNEFAAMTNHDVYVYDSEGASLGLSAKTDVQGIVKFSLISGAYKFKIDYLGYTFWSLVFCLPCTIQNYNFDIEQKSVKVTFSPTYNGNGVTPSGNYPVHVFTESGADTELDGTTETINSVISVNFNLPFKSYKFKLDYAGYSYWSSATTWADVVISPALAKAVITFKDGSVAKDGVPITAYTTTGTSIGTINTGSNNEQTGQATFYLTANGYKFHAIYSSIEYWGKIVTLSSNGQANLEINTNFNLFQATIKRSTSEILSNVDVHADATSGSFTSVTKLTNANGIVELRLPDGTYQFTVNYLGYEFISDSISVPSYLSTTMTITHHEVTVKLQKEQDFIATKVPGVEIRLYKANEYLGKTEVTDESDGKVLFDLPEKEYKFCGVYLGHPFSSDSFTPSSGPDNTVTITVNVDDIEVKVNRKYGEIETAVNDAEVHIYLSSSGTEVGTTKFTDGSGICTFTLPQEAYYFGVQYLIYSYQSATVTWTDAEISINEGKIALTVKIGDTVQSDRNAYVFDGNSYIGKSGTTDSDGGLTIQIPAGCYKIGIGTASNSIQYWTYDMTVNSGEVATEIYDIGADLTVAAIDFNPNPIRICEFVSVTAMVSNDGSYPAGDFVVRFYNGDPSSGGIQIGSDEQIDGLASGDTIDVPITWMKDTTGDFEIYVLADALLEVEESGEGNNKDHKTLTVIAENRFPYINMDSLSTCDYGIFMDHSSPTIEGSIFDSCGYSIYCDGSSPKIQDCAIYSPINAPVFSKSNSDPVLIDSIYARKPMTVQDSSKVTASYHFVPTIVNSLGEGIANQQVDITGWNQQNSAFSGTTNSYGQTNEILLKEFIQESNQITYYSPYLVNINNGENEFMLPMVSKKTLEIHAGGDTDNDGLTDSEEGGLFTYSLEAESMVFSLDQTVNDPFASAGMAIKKPSDTDKIVDSRLSSLPAGTYKCYVRARANPSGSRMSIDIYSNNNQIVSGETHSVGKDFEWYSTIAQANQNIVLQNNGDITMTVKDMDAITDGKIFVDKIMIVKLKNAQGEATRVVGQITDPTADDTDMDGLIDGGEARNGIFWFEAEDSPGALGLVGVSVASNGKIVSMVNNDLLSIPSPSSDISTGKYQYLVNARSEEAISQPSIKLEPCIDNVVQNSQTIQIGGSFNWYASQEFEIGSVFSSVTLKVTAIIPSGGQTKIYVDNIVLVQRKEIDVATVWSTQLSGSKTSPVIDSNYIYVGANDPQQGKGVFAFDKKTGESTHEYTDNNIKSVDGAPLVYDGKTYLAAIMNPSELIPADHGALIALDMSTDTGLWTNTYVSPLVGTPATNGKVIVIGAKDGTIHIIDIITGGTIDISTSYEILTSPVISNNKAFVGVKSTLAAPNNPKLYCIDLNPPGPGQQYSIKWTWYSDNKLTTPPLVADGMVIFPTTDNKVQALNENEGTEIWRTNINSPVLSTPVSLDTMILFGADDGKLYALNEDSGTISWSDNIGNQALESSPAVANNQVFFGSDNGFLCNYDPYTGDDVWNENVGGSADAIRTGPAVGDIDSDGELEIIICKGSFVHAVDGGGIYYRNEIPWAKESKSWNNNGNARYQRPYLATDPLAADTDSDGLSDSTETGLMGKWTRLESEDYSVCSVPAGGQNIYKHQFTVNLSVVNQQDSYIKFTQFQIPQTGMYHIVAEGTGTIEFKSGQYNGPAPPNADYNNPTNYQILGVKVPIDMTMDQEGQKDMLAKAINIELRRGIVPNIIINPPPNQYANIPPIDPLVELKNVQYSGMYIDFISDSNSKTYLTKRWHIEQDYELGSGLHEIKLLLDDPVFSGPFCTFLSGGGQLSVIPQKMDISTDFISISKSLYSAQDPDMDDDSLTDGEEIELGFYPINSDPDRDGISDKNELVYDTNPELRDTDMDGLRDRVELGLQSGDTDIYTAFDNGDPLNQDQSTTSTTDPIDPDSDEDGLPDGVVEGWGYNYEMYKRFDQSNWGRGYGIVYWTSDWTPKFWEGEDYDLDGDQDVGLWTFNCNNNPTGGETNPSAQDTDQDGIPDGTDTEKDGIPDGYEVWFRLHPKQHDAALDSDVGSQNSPYYYYTSPWAYPASPIASPDGLCNLDEYIIGTNPMTPDTDIDGVIDGGEVPISRIGCPVGNPYPVLYRTNVPNGGMEFNSYGSVHDSAQYEWVWVNGLEFGYSSKTDNADRNSQGAPDVNIFNGEMSQSGTPLRFISRLQDGTTILMDSAMETVYVWQPGVFTSAFFEGQTTGAVVIYDDLSSNGQAPASTIPLTSYRNREDYFSNPVMPDSDGDGRTDGMEIKIDWAYDPQLQITILTFIDTNGNIIPNEIRDYSADGDWLPNTREFDSDADGISDMNEAYCTIGAFDPRSDKTNPFNGDTDGDTLEDNDDPCPLDRDNDGLTGYPLVITLWGTFNPFIIGSLELLYGTININYDSDSDKLLDGPTLTIPASDPRYNVFNGLIYRTGVSSPYIFHGESEYHTDPMRADSDSDGLIDGIEVDSNDGFATNPLNNDSDSDGLPDGWVDGWNFDDYDEIYENTVTWGQSNIKDGNKQSWEGEDLDQNGNVLAGEWDISDDNWAFGHAETNPMKTDTDDGGGSDGLEIVWHNLPGHVGFSRLNPLSGADDEMIGYTYGVANWWILKYFPSLSGHLDDFNPDDNTADSDGLTNVQEYKLRTNPTSSDTDSDTMPDNWEVQYGLDPNNPADAILDKDKDGLSNAHEKTLGCDPTDIDCDNDGRWDGYYDANGDGNWDSNEVGEDTNDDGAVGSDETSPTDPDSDDDLIIDGKERNGEGRKYNIDAERTITAGATGYIEEKASVRIVFTSGNTGTATISEEQGVSGSFIIGSNNPSKISIVVIHIYYDKSTIGIDEENLAMYWKENGAMLIFSNSIRGEFTHVEPAKHFVWGVSNRIGTVTIGDFTQTDLDDDGLKDSEEIPRGSQIIWFSKVSDTPVNDATRSEVFYRVITGNVPNKYVDNQWVTEARKEAVCEQSGERIFTITYTSLIPGLYQIYVHARAVQLNTQSTPSITIRYEKPYECGHAYSLSSDWVGNNGGFYRWISLSPIQVDTTGELKVHGSNPSYSDGDALNNGIRVDKIILVRIDDPNNQILSRQISFADEKDTDDDSLEDSYEKYMMASGSPLAYWFEGEDYPVDISLRTCQDSPVARDDVFASMQRALVPDASGNLFSVPINILTVDDAGSFKCYARVRNPEGGMETTLQINKGTDYSGSVVIPVPAQNQGHLYKWYQIGAEITLGVGNYAIKGRVAITSASPIMIDKVCIIKTRQKDGSDATITFKNGVTSNLRTYTDSGGLPGAVVWNYAPPWNPKLPVSGGMISDIMDPQTDFEYDSLNDNDKDNLPTWWEVKWGINHIDLTGNDMANRDIDSDGIWNHLEMTFYKTNPKLPDTDYDGLSDGKERDFSADPLDPSSPGLYAIFETLGGHNSAAKTRTYEGWKIYSIIQWVGGNYPYTYMAVGGDPNCWMTIRQGTTVIIRGNDKGTLSISGTDRYGNSLTPLTPTDDGSGLWKITIPDTCTIGKYTITLTVSPSWSRSLDMYIIFKLPSTSGTDNSVSLTEAGLKSYDYFETGWRPAQEFEDPNYFRDRIAIFWYDDADVIKDSRHWTATYAYAFYTRHYSKLVLDKAVYLASGTSSVNSAATRIKDGMTQIRSMDTNNGYADMNVWLDTSKKSWQGGSQSECTAFAGASTALLRALGIPARPVFFDRACGDGGSYTTGTEFWQTDKWYIFESYAPSNGIKTQRDWGNSIWKPGTGENRVLIATAGPDFKIQQISLAIGWNSQTSKYNARDFDSKGVLLVGNPPDDVKANNYWDFIQDVDTSEFSSTNTGTLQKHTWVVSECKAYWGYNEPTAKATVPNPCKTDVIDPEPNDSCVGG